MKAHKGGEVHFRSFLISVLGGLQ